MKRIRIVIVCLGLLFMLSGLVTTPVYAWPWSDRANLSITVSPNILVMWDAIDCKSATLAGNGQYYYASSVTNPWLSNKCVFKFTNAYVGKGLNYTLSFSYLYSPVSGVFKQSFSKSVYVWVNRPIGTTYSTTAKYTP